MMVPRRLCAGAAAATISLVEEPAAHIQQLEGDTSPTLQAGGNAVSAEHASPAPAARLNAARRRAAAVALRRFADKLAGRDAELKSRAAGAGERDFVLSVPEQVTALLRASMSIDNLSRMYEGWTPWL
jgi:FATC domain